MPKLVKAKTVLTRFSDKIFAAIEVYAEDRGITRAEAVRSLVEDSFTDQKLRARNVQSFERLIQITEYMFHSTIAQNEEQFSPEKMRMIAQDTSNALTVKHPTVEEDY